MPQNEPASAGGSSGAPTACEVSPRGTPAGLPLCVAGQCPFRCLRRHGLGGLSCHAPQHVGRLRPS
eukprot:6669483-Alexandrium_andersonii.AAC.1